MEIFKLFGSILIDNDEADKSLSKTEKNTEKLSTKLGNGIKTAAKFGVGLATAAAGAGTALFALTNKATQAADAIAKGSERAGVSTDFYQEMTYWAGQNGVAHGQMEKALGRLNQRLGMALEGNEKYGDALERLGINLEDVENGTITTEDAFAQSIQTLSEMTNEHQKAELATEMFGVKLARDLLPALNDGSLSIDEARRKAQELGLVLEEDSLYAAEAFQDSWDDIKSSLGAAGTQIGLDLMPIFQKMLDWVLEHMPQIQEFIGTAMDYAGTAIEFVVDWIEKLISWLNNLRTENDSQLNTIQTKFKEVFDAVEGIIKTFIEWAILFWDAFGEDILGILETLWEQIKITFQAVVDTIVEIFKAFDALFRGDWEEFWESVKKIVETVGEFIWKTIENAIDIILRLFGTDLETVKQDVKDIFNNVKETIMGVFDTVVEKVEGAIEKIKGAIDSVLGVYQKAKDKVDGFVSGARDKISGAVSSVGNFASNLIPGLAEGGKVVSSGRVLVGEQGPEYLDLPRGAKVTPLDKAGDVVVNINHPRIYDNREIQELGSRLVSVIRTKTGVRNA